MRAPSLHVVRGYKGFAEARKGEINAAREKDSAEKRLVETAQFRIGGRESQISRRGPVRPDRIVNFTFLGVWAKITNMIIKSIFTTSGFIARADALTAVQLAGVRLRGDRLSPLTSGSGSRYHEAWNWCL